ncbi:dipeptidase [Arthrobacter crystallopoietes]|uniref:dipeptidase n=1 Tax=Crystallibacter crystallopoietes TaxID=37928 RepID=UPI0011111ACC|nr:dipeptidase [Arthrobacter crystallopoietes]QTG80191.1 dipeptidase [Arthrobacter crystallopoietes]
MTSPSDSGHYPAARRAQPVDVDALAQAVDARMGQTITSLKELVAIPGIAWEAFDPAELATSAETVAELIRGLGLTDVQILSVSNGETEGGPAVVARRPAGPGKPTVLLYAHHDVQPPGDARLWKTEPFAATEKDGRLFGRGAADDKAGIMAHVASLEALLATMGEDFGVGVTFFIEGEEEAGSPTFRTFLETHQELLRADVIIVADSANWKVGIPALTTSLRGLVDGVIELRVLEHAVHSGMFGGPLLDAPTLMARLISTFHDDAGEVAIEGLVSAAPATVDYPEEDFRRDSSVLESVQLAGTGSIADRLWNKPALSVIGMDVPSVALSSNTLLPSARAKISVRLAPGQDPDAAMEAIARHIGSHAPFGAEVSFAPGERGNAFATDTNASAAQAALWALGTAWNTQPVEAGMGGSIPFIADLTELFPQAQILITGVEDPDSRAHSANESLHLGDFRNAVLAEALLLARLNAAGL